MAEKPTGLTGRSDEQRLERNKQARGRPGWTAVEIQVAGGRGHYGHGGGGGMVGRGPRRQRNKATTSTRLNKITALLHGRIGQIATELHGAPTASTATLQRHHAKQGLLINLAQQDWYDFGSGRGGDAFSLIIWSKGYTRDEAIEWVREFVERTPDSPAVPAAPERDDPEVYTENKAKLSRAVPISGTLAEDYLRSRGIELPASSNDNLLWLGDARAGESAMVAVATDDNGGPVAFQLTYLQGDQKTPRQPARRTCKLLPDWKVSGVLRIGAVGNAERAAVTEGTEDGLSVHIATGLPVCVAWGVGAIRAPQSIRKVIIVPDYDPPRPDGEPHQTTKLVEQAIDAQLLSGDRSEVSLAAIPPGAICSATRW